MRTSFAKRSAPTLTAKQRRRQIIDLLAGHLARTAAKPAPAFDLHYCSSPDAAILLRLAPNRPGARPY